MSEEGINNLNIKKRKKINYTLPPTLRFNSHGNERTEYISICIKPIEST